MSSTTKKHTTDFYGAENAYPALTWRQLTSSIYSHCEEVLNLFWFLFFKNHNHQTTKFSESRPSNEVTLENQVVQVGGSCLQLLCLVKGALRIFTEEIQLPLVRVA